MNRTTATCIAGMTSKTTSRTRIHFFPRPREATPFLPVRPREAEPFTRFTRRFLAFGLGISPRDCGGDPSATRRHVALPRIANLEPREAKPFLRGFELCECSESVIIVTLTADPMIFLRAIPWLAVALTQMAVR